MPELIDNKYIITQIIRGGLLYDIKDVGSSKSLLHANRASGELDEIKAHAMCIFDAHGHGIGYTV